MAGWCSRHADSHGRGCDTVKDILDKLGASLSPCARLVMRHFVRENGLQKGVKLRLGLDQLCGLACVGERHSPRPAVRGSGGTYTPTV